MSSLSNDMSPIVAKDTTNDYVVVDSDKPYIYMHMYTYDTVSKHLTRISTYDCSAIMVASDNPLPQHILMWETTRCKELIDIENYVVSVVNKVPHHPYNIHLIKSFNQHGRKDLTQMLAATMRKYLKDELIQPVPWDITSYTKTLVQLVEERRSRKEVNDTLDAEDTVLQWYNPCNNTGVSTVADSHKTNGGVPGDPHTFKTSVATMKKDIDILKMHVQTIISTKVGGTELNERMKPLIDKVTAAEMVVQRVTTIEENLTDVDTRINTLTTFMHSRINLKTDDIDKLTKAMEEHKKALLDTSRRVDQFNDKIEKYHARITDLEYNVVHWIAIVTTFMIFFCTMYLLYRDTNNVSTKYLEEWWSTKAAHNTFRLPTISVNTAYLIVSSGFIVYGVFSFIIATAKELVKP